MNELEEYLKNELEIYCNLKNPTPVVPFIPSNVYIEPTTSCNLNCLFCARENFTRDIGFMSLEDFKQIINKFIEEDFHPPITITGQGEPLLHKANTSMIEYAKEKQFNVSLISNSTLLTEKNIDKLIKVGLDRFQTMFDSIDKTEYENLRRNSNYDEKKLRLINFIEKNNEMGHPIFISLGLVQTSINSNYENYTL